VTSDDEVFLAKTCEICKGKRGTVDGDSHRAEHTRLLLSRPNAGAVVRVDVKDSAGVKDAG
jgi:hypothetical protein